MNVIYVHGEKVKILNRPVLHRNLSSYECGQLRKFFFRILVVKGVCETFNSFSDVVH